MYRYIAVALFLAFAFQHAYGTNITIKDKDKKICLYAELMVNFTVSYQQDNKTNVVTSFLLPDNVTTNGSSCAMNTSVLKLNFGKGHSWNMTFQKKGEKYEAESIVFVYNLSDTTFFPHSKLKGTSNVTVYPKISDVGLNTCYSCRSEETLATQSVNQTLWNVLMQAFVINGTLSEKHTICAADMSTSTATPTTHSTTIPTTHPTTNSTTIPTTHPTTNSTTIPTTHSTTTLVPTTTPVPALPTPTTGNYSIHVNSSDCLLATFGLRIGVKRGDKYEEMNLNPNVTSASGSCGVEKSVLVLVSDTVNVTFTFTNDTKKFHLYAFSAAGKTGSGMSFSGANNNLSLWEAALSSSYMCNKEQNYSIDSSLTFFTFNLRVQPFGVSKNQFSTAHECELDDVSILIPVIVGCVLAGLIIIVVVAYLIGRRKTHAGYQTL